MKKDAVREGEAQEQEIDAGAAAGEQVVDAAGEVETAQAVDEAEPPESGGPGTDGELAEDALHEDEPAEDEAGEDEAATVEELREELAAAHAQAEEYLDRMQRTAAEFQNARRRQEKQLSDAIDRANARLISRLLPVLDDFDLAFQNAPQAASEAGEDGADSPDDRSGADRAWVDGFRQIQKKLLDLLAEEGVTPIEASGEFDPMRHEAVLSEESDEVESGHIIGVLRSGYEFKGQVLRPAMVRVAA